MTILQLELVFPLILNFLKSFTMSFNKGPAFGLTAEVKNKVSGLNARRKSNFFVSSIVVLVEPNHLGLHLDMRVQI